MIEVQAHLRFVRLSPKKARLLLRGLRGKSAEEVATRLALHPQKTARLLRKVVLSALANARHNLNLEPRSLVIKRISVNTGPTYKRYWLRSRGQVDLLRKRTSHFSVVLEEQKTKSGGQKTEGKEQGAENRVARPLVAHRPGSKTKKLLESQRNASGLKPFSHKL